MQSSAVVVLRHRPHHRLPLLLQLPQTFATTAAAVAAVITGPVVPITTIGQISRHHKHSSSSSSSAATAADFLIISKEKGATVTTPSAPAHLINKNRDAAVHALLAGRLRISDSNFSATLKQKQTRNMSFSSAVNSSSGKGTKVLTVDTINPNVLTMEYAVRGPIVNRAVELEKKLAQAKEKEFPFNSVIKANIGDAHAMGQTPITFIRQVLACVSDPSLITSPDTAKHYPEDVKQKALMLLRSCGGGSAGSYSQSTGLDSIRKHVAEFVARRDGFECDPESVCLSGGASESIRNVLKLFVHRGSGTNRKKAGIMVPIPQYPLYSASIEEFNLGQVGYFLDEQNNWALDMNELEQSLREHKSEYDVRAIVVINPGNPTGQVLTCQNIEHIIRFAHQHRLFIFADEVYQENVYAKGALFHSFRKVMHEMGSPYAQLELASFYSCSKGYMGECGLRGGYVQFENLDPDVYAHFKKMISAKLCSTVLGQATMDCIVDHPKQGDPSYELWLEEKTAVLASLDERAKMVTKAYNQIEGVHCQEVQGAMYAFPRLELPDKLVAEAKASGVQPDFLYCSKLLEATGICVVPGSGFGQRPGTWHFRTTILPPIKTFEEMLRRFRAFHEDFLARYQ